MKRIIISGVNLVNGGPLSIIRDVLTYLSENLYTEWEIIALVSSKELFKDISNVSFIEFPKSKTNWLNRLYYEYFYFYKISKRYCPYLWLSLHDITPNVLAEKKAVYCHNPSPFYKMNSLEKKLDFKFTLFNLLYKYLYKVNIKKNTYVIVQQDWLRSVFKDFFGIKNIIVAYPQIMFDPPIHVSERFNKKTFFYAAYPRVFKNFEIICETAKFFEHRNDIEFVITISGDENKYSQYLYRNYKHLSNLKFIGLLTRDDVFKYYNSISALIFPSKLETWGLPITEFKNFNKPIFLADLPYAKETIGDYHSVSFFDPNNAQDLIEKIGLFIEDKLLFEKTTSLSIKEPFTRDWGELFRYLLKDKK